MSVTSYCKPIIKDLFYIGRQLFIKVKIWCSVLLTIVDMHRTAYATLLGHHVLQCIKLVRDMMWSIIWRGYYLKDLSIWTLMLKNTRMNFEFWIETTMKG